MTGDVTARRVAAAAAALALVVAGLGAATPATAGDASGTFQFDPLEVEVEPGETVTLDVTLATDGGYAGEGVDTYEYTVAYDPEVVSVVDVEHGSWLDGEGHTVETSAERADGRVHVSHERRSRREGATGSGVTATVTLAVAEDAPPSDVVVVLTGAEGTFTSGAPMATYVRNATLVVGGGGSERRPDVGGDGNGAVDITTPSRTPTGGTAAGDGTPTGDGGDTATPGDGATAPGFGPLAAVVALIVVVVGPVLFRRGRRPSSDAPREGERVD